jgi:hypothetical protein
MAEESVLVQQGVRTIPDDGKMVPPRRKEPDAARETLVEARRQIDADWLSLPPAPWPALGADSPSVVLPERGAEDQRMPAAGAGP